MGRHADVPVVFDGGVEYVPSSTQVHLERAPRRGGFGNKRAVARDTYPIGDCGRDRASTVTMDDGRVGRTETWEEEAMRLRGEVDDAREQISALSADVAKLMVS